MNLTEANKQQLREAFAVRASVPGGLMNLIGLDELREQFPDSWPRHKERIVATARSIVKQYTDPATDIVLEIGGGNFVLLFTRLDKQDALLRTTAIKAEILRHFMGDEALQTLDLQVHAMELDSGAITSGTLGEILSSAISRTSAPAPTAPANDAVKRKAPKAKPSEVPKDHLALDALVKRFEFSLDALEFGFQPFLHASREVFSVFVCRPVRYSATREILTGYEVLPRDADTDQITALDEMTLVSAGKGLVDMAVRGRVGIVVVPVSFETMTDRRACAEYIRTLQTIPSDLRNHLVPILSRFPVGVPEGRLSEIIGTLKRLCRAVCMRIESGRQSLAVVKAAGAFSIGFNLSASSDTDFATAGYIERHAAAARKVGLHTFVDGISTPELERRCRAAKIDFLGGRAIAEICDYVGPAGGRQVA